MPTDARSPERAAERIARQLATPDVRLELVRALHLAAELRQVRGALARSTCRVLDACTAWTRDDAGTGPWARRLERAALREAMSALDIDAPVAAMDAWFEEIEGLPFATAFPAPSLVDASLAAADPNATPSPTTAPAAPVVIGGAERRRDRRRDGGRGGRRGG